MVAEYTHETTQHPHPHQPRLPPPTHSHTHHTKTQPHTKYSTSHTLQQKTTSKHAVRSLLFLPALTNPHLPLRADFDLVRIYHPDKASSSVPPDLAHERFQAITTAYDILRGKKPYPGASTSGASGVEDRSYQTTAAYRAARRRRQELYSSGAVDDRWKDRIFLGLAFAVSWFAASRDFYEDSWVFRP